MAENIQTGAHRQQYSSQTKLVALSVHQYLRRLHPSFAEGDIDQETATATGISVRSLHRFKREAKEGCISSPPKKRMRKSPVLSIDTFEEECIRRVITSFYERGEIPTLKNILEQVKEAPISFKGQKSSLYKLMKKLGFRFKKTDKGRHILMEREDIVLTRCTYLRKVKENRDSSNPRPEIYMGETWVSQNECVDKCWTTVEEKLGPKVKSGRGARYIIVHAGGMDGFVPGGLHMFRSKNENKGDYHDSMNHNTFRSWLENNLLPNIPPRSLIIMDNASYHCKVINKAPTQSSRKNEIIEWLERNDLPHSPLHTKPELLHQVKKNKQKEVYEIDDIAMRHGHEVLRLPPYHCQLNPIELIWARVKEDIRKNISNSNQNGLQPSPTPASATPAEPGPRRRGRRHAGDDEVPPVVAGPSGLQPSPTPASATPAEPVPRRRGRRHASDDDVPPVVQYRTSTIASVSGFQWSTRPQTSSKTRVAARNVVHETLGPTHDAQNALSYRECFNLFWNDRMIEEVREWTNAKIRQEAAKYGRVQVTQAPVTMLELKAFIGIHIFAGSQKDNHMSTREMWQVTSSPVYRAVMSVGRFEFLINCLRFDDPDTRVERRATDKFAPIRKIWDIFSDNCRRMYTPSEHLCVDEQLVAFRGRCPFRMYIPLKPAKYGLKIFMLTDNETKYLCAAIPYLGKGTVESVFGENLGHTVIKSLARPYFRSNRNITADNWFMSVPMVTDLLTNCGLPMLGQ
ncbi:hypothetical protein Pmani_005113 [Petrolisthes manimaculis]|uniref:Transposase n=1 Tax=Petrolisthes manimaculis TaxID=1843537 RepID=A0AAE1UGZ6_9EUCA|nr:hypothetical protein Pmani_005113 [Petrolisthes manimaculis]